MPNEKPQAPAPYSMSHAQAHRIANLMRLLSYIHSYQMRNDPGATNETVTRDYDNARDEIIAEVREWIVDVGLAKLP